jgi:hypothetical protein
MGRNVDIGVNGWSFLDEVGQLLPSTGPVHTFDGLSKM